jgi:hypothetical protein
VEAKALLRQLKANTLDRSAVTDPASRAIVEFADWLAFPTELGEYPDEIDVIDARALHWPPAGGKTTSLTLLRYRMFDTSGLEPDDVGVGLVGGVTFSMFSYENHQRPPEDAYAIHCYWECAQAELVSESDSVSPDQVGRAIAASGVQVENAAPLVTIKFVKRGFLGLGRALDYPGDEVGLVAGEYQGEAGWLICDGPRSTWYPASDMPEDAPPETVAMVHVGRVLLGFKVHRVERRKFKLPSYQLTDDEFLNRYERALSAARNAPESEREDAFGWLGVLGRYARRRIGLLTAAARSEEVSTFIDELATHWDHNSGYAELGTLAFEARLFDRSKQFIEKLRRSYEDHHRSETMGLLARIYAREGRALDGIALLRECISKIKSDESCSPHEVARFSAPLVAALSELEHTAGPG